MKVIFYDWIFDQIQLAEIPAWEFCKTTPERWERLPVWARHDIIRSEIKIRNEHASYSGEYVFIVDIPAYSGYVNNNTEQKQKQNVDENATIFICCAPSFDSDGEERWVKFWHVSAVFSSMEKAMEWCKKHPAFWYIRGISV